MMLLEDNYNLFLHITLEKSDVLETLNKYNHHGPLNLH